MGNFIDMTGWKMWEHGVPDSRFEVIRRAPNNGKHVAWYCRCRCGNELNIRGDQLRSGIAKSCGCLQKEIASICCAKIGKNNQNMVSSKRLNLVGQVFGELTVIKFAYTKNKRAYWNCLCKCGNYHIIEGTKLKSGHTRSCGCIKSFGESKISQILSNSEFTFLREYSFPDLIDKGRLRFDFAIFNKDKLVCLLEYQGQQHYKQFGSWTSPVEHDEIKRQYCKRNGIKLIEIPYTDFDKLSLEYLKEKICTE